MPDPTNMDELARMITRGNEYSPDQQAKLRALRGQQALGLLGTVAQGQTGKFGENLYGDAEAQTEAIAEERSSGLERAKMQLQIANEYRDLTTAKPGTKQYDFKTVDKQLYRVNPYSGQVERVGGGGGQQVEPWMAQNEAGELVFNPSAPPPQMDLGTEEGKAFNWSMTSMRAFNEMQDMMAKGFEPTLTSSLLGKDTWGAASVARWTSDEQDQKYAASKIKLAESILRSETGAQAPEPEQVRAMVAWLPDYYEDPQTIQWKMEQLRSRVLDTVPRAGRSAYDYLNAAASHYMGPPAEEV